MRHLWLGSNAQLEYNRFDETVAGILLKKFAETFVTRAAQAQHRLQRCVLLRWLDERKQQGQVVQWTVLERVFGRHGRLEAEKNRRLRRQTPIHPTQPKSNARIGT